MHTEQCYHYLISWKYFKVVRITMMPPSDVKSLSTKTYAWKLHAELGTKRLSGFHHQRNVASKFIEIEIIGLPMLGLSVTNTPHTLLQHKPKSLHVMAQH